MMTLLQEMKGVRYTLDQIAYYGYQQYIRSAGSPLHQQPTIAEMFRRQQCSASGGGTGGGAKGGVHGAIEPLTRKVRVVLL